MPGNRPEPRITAVYVLLGALLGTLVVLGALLLLRAIP